jgi:hypothetical protein
MTHHTLVDPGGNVLAIACCFAVVAWISSSLVFSWGVDKDN